MANPTNNLKDLFNLLTKIDEQKHKITTAQSALDDANSELSILQKQLEGPLKEYQLGFLTEFIEPAKAKRGPKAGGTRKPKTEGEANPNPDSSTKKKVGRKSNAEKAALAASAAATTQA